MPRTGTTDQALRLAQKLEFDAVVEGLTLEDLEIQRAGVETYLRDIISQVGEPGTSGA
jgi:hypothetical protein